MKTTHHLKQQIERDSFMPVDGSWTAELNTFEGKKTDSEGNPIEADCFDAIPFLEAAIEKEVGYPVVVQIFHDNGHEINDNACDVDGGSMLVTQATRSEIKAKKAYATS